MGFVLSILYFATYYLTPATLFGPLAAIHIEVVVGILVFIVSLPALHKSIVTKTPQSVALLGLALAIFMSLLVGLRWPRAAVNGAIEALPQGGVAYFLVCLHFNSKNKLKVLVLLLLFVCLFVMAHGSIDLLHGVSHNTGGIPWDIVHPYLMDMPNQQGEWIYRLRGLGEIHDPNDFGQLITCLIPLMFIFWRHKKTFHNTFLVLLPVCALIVGAFLTHSRGALLALMVVAVVAARRRIGTVPSLVLAAGLFAAAMALHFTGGRDISAESGEGRIGLWGQGMGIFKSHPLFGVGAGQMGQYTDDGHTAHNTVVVCAAELGLFGLYFWSLFLYPTLRDVIKVASPNCVTEAKPAEAEPELYPQAAKTNEALDKSEINRLGRLMLLSLTGFLAAAFFLSRAYVLTLYLLGGMAEVVYEMALKRGMIAPRLALGRAMKNTGVFMIALLVFVYVMIRVLNVMR